MIEFFMKNNAEKCIEWMTKERNMYVDIFRPKTLEYMVSPNEYTL